MSEVEKVIAALEATLEDEYTAELFGAPVDIPGYTDIIEKPVDLGTLLLEAKQGKLKDAAEAWNLVNLMWSNCKQYNNTPADEPIIQAMKSSQALWNREWRAAGLSIPRPSKQDTEEVAISSQEASLPANFGQLQSKF